MIHSYDVDVAKVVGVKEAVLLYAIDWWIAKNRANGTNYHDGKYWTYNSIKAYTELFPEFTVQNLRTILKHLEEGGYIETGNFNKATYDRTQWYALTDKYYTLKGENQQMHLLEPTNGSVETNKPIPVNNTVNNTINNSANELFDRLWALYPKKRGKSSVKPATRKKLLLVGEEEMIKAVTRYAEECKGKDPQYIMNGSTFFNGRYEDYLGNDFTPIPKSNVPSPSKPFVPEPPRYQKFEKEEHIDAVPMNEEQRANMEALRRKLGAIG